MGHRYHPMHNNQDTRNTEVKPKEIAVPGRLGWKMTESAVM
jgi:hypothetical protein